MSRGQPKGGCKFTYTTKILRLLSILNFYHSVCGPGISVGIATGYGLDGPGIETWWGARFTAPVQTGPGAHPASCTMGTGSFPGVKSGRGVTLTPHPLLVPLVMKGQSYTSTPPMGRTTCTEPQCLYKGALYLFYHLVYVCLMIANFVSRNMQLSSVV